LVVPDRVLIASSSRACAKLSSTSTRCGGLSYVPWTLPQQVVVRGLWKSCGRAVDGPWSAGPLAMLRRHVRSPSTAFPQRPAQLLHSSEPAALAPVLQALPRRIPGQHAAVPHVHAPAQALLSPGDRQRLPAGSLPRRRTTRQRASTGPRVRQVRAGESHRGATTYGLVPAGQSSTGGQSQSCACWPWSWHQYSGHREQRTHRPALASLASSVLVSCPMCYSCWILTHGLVEQ